MNKLTEKWKLPGLLDNLTDNECDVLALILESLTLRLIKIDGIYTEKEQQFNILIIAVVRVLFDKLKLDIFPEIDWLIQDFKQWLSQNYNVISYDEEPTVVSRYVMENFKTL